MHKLNGDMHKKSSAPGGRPGALKKERTILSEACGKFALDYNFITDYFRFVGYGSGIGAKKCFYRTVC